MLGDIDRSLEPKQYELILCKPDGAQIAVLDEAFGIKHDPVFPTTSEFSFTIPYYVTEDGKRVKNENFDLVVGDYLILLNNEQYYIISEPEATGNEKSSKTLQCYSREHELNKKKIRGYSLVSRKLWTATAEKDADGEYLGVVNYIETMTTWRFDTASLLAIPTVTTKHRGFDVSEKTLLAFLTEDVQKAYGCVFTYDTINRVIYTHELETLRGTKGLYISEANYLKSIKDKLKHDSIVTRLYLRGKDDITVSTVNPTGTPYIEDFSFYKDTKYMSQGLIDALNAYDSLLAYHKTNKTFDTLLENLSALQDTLITKDIELATLKNNLAIKNNEIDGAIRLGNDLTTLNQQRDVIESDIAVKKNEIVAVQNSISSVNANISAFRANVSKQANFTNAQIIELDYFIREDTFSDSAYETPEDLYEEGIKQMARLSQPPLEFSIDVIDFLKVVEAQHDWNKLVLGDIVTIEYEDFNRNIDMRLIGYSHDYDGNKLTLKFSSKDSLDDPYAYLADLQKNAITSSTTIDMSKYKWDKSSANESAIRNIIDSDLDTSKRKVLAGANQDVVIDERGIWLTEKDVGGNVKPEQIRMINNVIALSKDGFNTATTAITPDGVNAQTLMGKTIIGQQGLFDGIDIFDGGANPVVTVGKYMGFDDLGNPIEKKGIRINGGSLDIVNELPPAIKDQFDIVNGAIDGKVDVYYKGYAPTLANDPAASWTSTALKDIHVGDMFFDTRSGYESAYRFNKISEGVYEWTPIGDKDVVKALSDASKAQQTADSKTTVFLMTPVPPYNLGDLWRYETGTAPNTITNTKICISEKMQGQAFSESDWAETINVDDRIGVAMTSLETDIMNSFADDKLTSIEANGLKVSFNATKEESLNLVSEANTLGITTERTAYSNSVATLETEINKWINKSSYPIPITVPTDRDNITAKFKSVESAKTALINKIAAIRQANAQGYADIVVDGVRVGGTNIVLKSGEYKASSSYLIQSYDTSEDFLLNQNYAITIKGYVNSGQSFRVYTDNGFTQLCNLSYDASSGLWKGIANISSRYSGQITPKKLQVYNYPSATAVSSDIEWIQIEKGNKFTVRNIAYADTVKRDVAYNGVSMDTSYGMKVSTVVGGVAKDKDVQMILSAGSGTDGKCIDIQRHNGSSWISQLYANSDGKLVSKEMIANDMTANNLYIDGGNIYGGTGVNKKLLMDFTSKKMYLSDWLIEGTMSADKVSGGVLNGAVVTTSNVDGHFMRLEKQRMSLYQAGDTPKEKMAISFYHDGYDNVPIIIMGAGSGTGTYGKMTIAKNTYSAEMIYYNSTNGAQQKIEYTDNYLNISAYGNTPSGGALRLNSNRDIWITAETAIGGDNSIKMRGYTVSSWVGDGGFVIRNTDGVAKHVFTNLGGKPAGGSIEIDGRTLGMSPTDSPQVLIEYVDFDVHLTTSGTKVYLDPTYLKAIGNRFAAFSSNGKIIEKGLDYIVISGEGMADIRYVGERIGEEGRFFCDITNV